MGRPKDSSDLCLAGPDNSPLPITEFWLIDQPQFTVPFDHIKVVESRQVSIPGLWTPEVAVKDKYLAQKNKFPVKVIYQAEDNFSEICFVVNGRMSVGELAAMVHSQLDLNAAVVVELLVDQKIVPYDTLLMKVYAESMSSAGFLDLVCSFGDGDGLGN